MKRACTWLTLTVVCLGSTIDLVGEVRRPQNNAAPTAIPTWLPAGSAPLGRQAHAMAHDSARGRVVLFGGKDGSGSVLGDTWEWVGTAWVQRKPATGPPA